VHGAGAPSQELTGSIGTSGIMPVGRPSLPLSYFGERCEVLNAQATFELIGKVSKPDLSSLCVTCSSHFLPILSAFNPHAHLCNAANAV
jgi:hypothetical protein